MRSHDPKILLALLLALSAHLLVLYIGQRSVRRELGWWLEVPQADFSTHDELGESNARGRGANAESGDQPMVASIAFPLQDQPVMQREPMGIFSPAMPDLALLHPPASPSPTNSQSQNLTGSTDALSDPAPPPILQDTQPDTAAPRSPDAAKKSPSGLTLIPAPIHKPPIRRRKNSQPSPPSSGVPLPSSDFESVPVTKVAGVFRLGKVELQNGRQWKPRRMPNLDVAAWADLSAMPDPHIVMQLTIDETGNVINVQTVQSSGSVNVDHASEQAANSWWFEPRKNPKTGKFGREVIEFTIIY